jgi:hypothetical protein
MIRSLTLAAVLGAAAASGAAAQGLTVYGGAALQFHTDSDDPKTDLNGYVEAEMNGFYGGIWAEVSNQSDANEVDLYLGYRNSVGALSYDANYTRYIYPNDGGDCCGEFGLTLDYAVNDMLTLGTTLAYDPPNETGSAYATFSVAATDKLSISGEYGFYDEGYGDYKDWDIGVGYQLGEETSAELRYYKGEEYDGYLRLQLSWDTTILSR